MGFFISDMQKNAGFGLMQNVIWHYPGYLGAHLPHTKAVTTHDSTSYESYTHESKHILTQLL